MSVESIAMSNLKQFLKNTISSMEYFAKSNPKNILNQGFQSTHSYVYGNGNSFKSEPLTEEQNSIVRSLTLGFDPQAKECFFNAMLMCVVSLGDEKLNSRLKYCEGYVLSHSVLPIHHAWVTLDGKVVDVTLTSTKYTTEQLTSFMENGVKLPRNKDLSDRILGEIPKNWEYYGVEFDSVKVGQEFISSDREYTFSWIEDWEKGSPLLRRGSEELV